MCLFFLELFCVHNFAAVDMGHDLKVLRAFKLVEDVMELILQLFCGSFGRGVAQLQLTIGESHFEVDEHLTKRAVHLVLDARNLKFFADSLEGIVDLVSVLKGRLGSQQVADPEIVRLLLFHPASVDFFAHVRDEPLHFGFVGKERLAVPELVPALLEILEVAFKVLLKHSVCRLYLVGTA